MHLVAMTLGGGFAMVNCLLHITRELLILRETLSGIKISDRLHGLTLMFLIRVYRFSTQ